MNNCKESYDALVSENIDYAKRLAYQFHGRRQNMGVELDDLIGAAFLGLCDAAKKFDPSQNQKFRTYSYLRIRGSMYDLLRSSGGVSRTHYAAVCRSNDADSLNADQKENTEQEERLPYSMARDCKDLRRLEETIREFGICIHVNGDRDHVDISYAWHQSPEEEAMSESVSHYLDQRMNYLPELERNVLKQRYFEEKSFQGMSKQFNNMSKSWLSRLHLRALGNLKGIVEADGYQAIAELNSMAV